MKPPNKEVQALAEGVEEGALVKENSVSAPPAQAVRHPQAGPSVVDHSHVRQNCPRRGAHFGVSNRTARGAHNSNCTTNLAANRYRSEIDLQTTTSGKADTPQQFEAQSTLILKAVPITDTQILKPDSA